MNGAGYPFHGSFDREGRINLPVIRRALTPVVLDLQADLTGLTNQIHGTVINALGSNVITGILHAARNPFRQRSNPAPQTGRHPFALQAIPEEGGATVVHDAFRGPVTFDHQQIDDQVLLKSDGYPTYHLAAQVDDHLMQTTHVLRGEEWLPSAPRHFLIYRAFGWEPPAFAHLSRILGPDRAKLSKRHGAHAALEYREQGYLPDAVVNFLALLGWSLDDHTEIIDRATLIRHFDLDRVLTNPAVFNAEKLLWMNGVYIREMPDDKLADEVAPFLERHRGRPVDRGLLMRIIPLVKERIKLLSEIVDMADFFFMDGELDYDVETLLGKRYAGDAVGALEALDTAAERLEAVDAWGHEKLEAAVRPLAEELGVKTGDLFGVLRVAVTGKTATPPLFETMELLGQQRTLERLRRARERLRGQAPPAK